MIILRTFKSVLHTKILLGLSRIVYKRIEIFAIKKALAIFGNVAKFGQEKANFLVFKTLNDTGRNIRF